MNTSSFAKYACDVCHTRKVSCTREFPKCVRCNSQGLSCSYSRSGKIRRFRKRKHKASPLPSPRAESPNERRLLPSTAAEATAAATERLRGLVGREHASLKELASLMSEYHTAWQDSDLSAFEKMAEGAQTHYYTFPEEQGRIWADALETALHHSKLPILSVPSEVLENLIASRPHRIKERAWLVMFYSIALHSLAFPTLTAAVKSNLWLAFNDARFLLGSSVLNIQALLVMIRYLEAYTTPHACWMLNSKACTMLIALGIGTPLPVDAEERKQRDVLFWHLSSLEKTLSLILLRASILPRDLECKMRPPALEDFLPAQPRGYETHGMPVLFSAHYELHMYLLSRIKADIWHCVRGQQQLHLQAGKLRRELDKWYDDASKILTASSLTETPLLNPLGLAAIDLRTQTLRLQFYFLATLLEFWSKEGREKCVGNALHLFNLLPRIGALLSASASASAETAGVALLWQYMHYPMTALGKLWVWLLSKGREDAVLAERVLETIPLLPPYLQTLIPRNRVAAKLHSIAERMIAHVNLIYHADDPPSSPAAAEAQHPLDIPTVSVSSAETTFDAEALLDSAVLLPEEFLLDPVFELFSWGEGMGMGV